MVLSAKFRWSGSQVVSSMRIALASMSASHDTVLPLTTLQTDLNNLTKIFNILLTIILTIQFP